MNIQNAVLAMSNGNRYIDDQWKITSDEYVLIKCHGHTSRLFFFFFLIGEFVNVI